MNAIVWLYRGEIEKYTKLLKEYKEELDSDKAFDEQIHDLSKQLKELRKEAKNEIENATRNIKKKIQSEYDEKIAELERRLIIAKEANWIKKNLVKDNMKMF